MNKIKILIAFFLVLAGFCPSARAFEDVRYDLEGSFDPAQKTIVAQETLTFKNTCGVALPEVYLRVYPHHRYSPREKHRLYQYASYFRITPYPDGFDPGAFEVSGVSLDGKDAVLPYVFEGDDQTLIKIVLPEPAAQGALVSLRISFTMKVPHRLGRFGWHRRTFALNRWYPLLAYHDGQSWRKHPDYLMHMPYVSDAASYHLRLDLPSDMVVAAGCDDVVEEALEGGRKRVTMKHSGLLRELSLALSADYEIYEKQEGGVTIRSYHFPGDREAGVLAASHAADLLRYYQEHVGPYPYKRFSIAPVYLGYGGSQNAGIIFLDTRVYRLPPFLKRYFDFLVAHETGHQWWYNVVGNDEFKELWLDEGVNSYWIGRYLQEKYGFGAKVVDMPSWLEAFLPNPTFGALRTYRYWYFSKKGLDEPVLTEMSSFYEPSLIFTVAYGKGSAVVDMLRERMGAAAFEDFTKKYFKSFAYRVASVDDFIRLAEETSSQDLKGFFKEWLYTAEVCDYGLARRDGRLILKRTGGVRMPVETRLVYQDGSQDTFSSDGVAAQEVLPLSPGKKLVSAAVDPDRKLLDIDRVDNHYPRLLKKKFVPLYQGFYDIPLFAGDDAYVWTTGPSVSSSGIGVKSTLQRPGDWLAYAATHYDGGIEALHSSAGFEKNNIAQRFMSFGAEFLDRRVWGDEEDDLTSYKVYLRHELGLGYSFLETSSHATLYLLHNLSLGKSGYLGGKEEALGRQYRKKKETIAGLALFFSNAGSLPDPSTGYTFSASGEIGGHMLGGADAFLRSSVEYDRYVELGAGHKIAWRLKSGGGYPNDKYLFYLGSDKELRGYDYKTVQGSSCLLGSLEYRFPLARDIDARGPYDLAVFDGLQGVIFFDAGSAWYEDFNEPGIRRDVGFGLRFYFNIAGAAERLALRVDVAHPLDGDDKDTHLWVGVNQAF